MENTIELYLKRYLDTIPKESIDQFKQLFTLRKVVKDEVLLHQGKKSTKFYIIKEGLVASFIRHEDGNDFIRTIYTPLNELGSLNSIIRKKPSNANYKCLTNGEVIEACFDNFIKLTITEPIFSIVYTKVLEQKYLSSEKRIDELSTLNGTQRYIELKKDIYDIDNLLPQYQIAKYLCITPVQLSRIRKKMFTKQ